MSFTHSQSFYIRVYALYSIFLLFTTYTYIQCYTIIKSYGSVLYSIIVGV